MALFELHTYQIYVGQLGEVVKIYGEFGWPALKNGGFDAKLVGYFTSDTGGLNQLVHLWKFDDDADRRNHWATLFKDADFMAFGGKIRPLIMTQTVQLLNEAPWGPHP
jgi:hypothetical protein